MRILLIQPPRPQHGVVAEKHWQLTRPFSLLYLATALTERTPYQVEVLDLEHPRYRGLSREEVLDCGRCEIFGITASTHTRFEAIEIARFLKRAHPGSHTILGGPHFMYCAEQTLEEIPEVDVVVRGEGEMPLVEVARAIDSGSGLHGIPGVSFRDGGVVHNPEQTSFIDLDSLRSYCEFSWEEYPEYLFNYPEQVRATSVMTSRGCPYRCVFCSKAGMKYRLRSPRAVAEEIERLHRRFEVEGFNFLDLTFTAVRDHVEAVCRELVALGVPIRWWCESRVNIPLDLLEVMQRAGCVAVVIGVESGSSKVLSTISKSISVDQVRAFCRRSHDLGIVVTPYFMYSHPGETVADVEQTLELMFELERHTEPCAFQPSMVFPGTELERMARGNGTVRPDFSWNEPYQADLNLALGQLPNLPIFIDRISPDELVRLHNVWEKERALRDTVRAASSLSFGELAKKGLNAVLRGKPSARYLLSPKFFIQYLIGKRG